MAKTESNPDSPTMIIPNGADIQVDVHGQLSVKAPGNLVIQNSGHYGTLESVGGSIRIESNAEVEAVDVRCADICYIQGSLTAWRVTARSIQLEEGARASIVLQETERLEIGREARLVGNFASEKELFLLFSRFARNFRSMPFFFDRDRPAGELSASGDESSAWPALEGPVAEAGEEAVPEPERPGKELPEPLFFSLVLLERERSRDGYGPTSRRVLEELVKLLKEDDREALRLTYRTLFGRIREPGKDVRRAEELMRQHFTPEPAR